MTHSTKCPVERQFRTWLGHSVKVQSHLELHSLPSMYMWVSWHASNSFAFRYTPKFKLVKFDQYRS